MIGAAASVDSPDDQPLMVGDLGRFLSRVWCLRFLRGVT
jgi:hypothetical protein